MAAKIFSEIRRRLRFFEIRTRLGFTLKVGIYLGNTPQAAIQTPLGVAQPPGQKRSIVFAVRHDLLLGAARKEIPLSTRRRRPLTSNHLSKFDLSRTVETFTHLKLIAFERACLLGFCWLLFRVIKMEIGF